MTYSKQCCSKCNVLKPIEDFNIDRKRKSGRQRYCRVCRNQARREFDARKKAETGWIVYILPEENYAGLSNNVYKRIANHACDGKNVTNWFIHSEHIRPEHAIIAEALLHLDGYLGCTYKNK
jgi:hypothetical protein